MKLFACLAVAWAACLTWLGLYHPYGVRFAIGTWPVPQGTPWTYQLESGFVPALTVLTLLTGLFSLYHLHNCHYETCWRLGKHKIGGTPWCSRHQHLGHEHREVAEILEDILTELRSWRVKS